MITLALDYRSLHRTAFDRTEDYLAELADGYAARFDGVFEATAQVARTMATVLSAHPDFTEAELFDLLQMTLKQNPRVYGSCVAFEPFEFSADRKLFAPYVCREGSAYRRMDLTEAYDYTNGQWEWYSRPRELGAWVWTEPYFDEGAGNISMVTHSAPFFRNGKLRGIATVDVRLDDLQQSLQMAELTGAEWLICSDQGTFVSAADPGLILKETLYSFAEKHGRPELRPLIDEMVAGHRGKGRINSIRTGEPMLVFYSPIRSTGWCFLAGVSEAAALAPVSLQLQHRTGALLMGVLAMLGIVSGASFWLTRPIDRLTTAVKQLSTGNMDTRIASVRTQDELGDLALAFNSMVKQLRDHVAALTVATAAREAVESELRVAREIQSSLLPQTFPPFPHRQEIDLHAVNAPARHVAGDFFDFQFIDDDTLMLVIADVSGKGVPAALLMAVTRTLLRNFAMAKESPGSILSDTNKLLCENNDRGMFVTLFLGFYKVKSGRLTYANAGHPLPIRVSADGRASECCEGTGTVLGVIPNEVFEERTEMLQPGDTLVLYTDGVTEASEPAGQMFGTDHFAKVLASQAGQPPEALCTRIIEAVNNYQEGERQDDITLLLIRRNS